MSKEKSNRFPFSTFIVGASFIITVIALIPAFFALNKEKPDLHYSYVLTHYEAPDGIDAQLFNDFLIENNIAPHRLSIQIKNAGNAPSKKIKISVNTPDLVVRYSYTPSQEDNPVWVVLPPNKELGFESDIRNVVQEFKDLAPNKMLIFDVSYMGVSQDKPEIEIFGDLMEATFLNDIKDLRPWSPYKVFLLPIYILGGGLLLTFLWIIGSVISSDPQYKRMIINAAHSILDSFALSFGFSQFNQLFGSIKWKSETEQEDKIDEEED